VHSTAHLSVIGREPIGGEAILSVTHSQCNNTARIAITAMEQHLLAGTN